MRFVLALVVAVVLSACGGTQAPASGTPGSVVNDALAKVAAKDVEGLRSLACAGQQDMIRQQLEIAGLGAEAALLPGLDVQALVDATTLDVSGVRLGDATINGDVATVPVTGSMKVTFDSARLRPLLKQVLEQSGTTMTDDQLDALLKSLATYGQDVPIDQTVRLVREGGAWKVCQESIQDQPRPSPSASP